MSDEPLARPTTWLFDKGREMRLSDAVYCICVSDPNKSDASASATAKVGPPALLTRGKKRRVTNASPKTRPATNRAFPLRATMSQDRSGDAVRSTHDHLATHQLRNALKPYNFTLDVIHYTASSYGMIEIMSRRFGTRRTEALLRARNQKHA